MENYTNEKTIQKALEKESMLVTPDYAQRCDYSVWICYGNGEIVSPQLKNSAGNIGYCELFEYSPEIEPSKEFVDLLDELVN